MKGIRKLLEYGEIKELAKKNGLTIDRASSILNGRTNPKDADEPFLMACFDRTLPRKKRFDKLKQLAA